MDPVCVSPGGVASPPSKEPKKKAPKKMVEGLCLAMDLQWGGLMNEHNKKKVCSQLSMGYSCNRRADKAIKTVYTSVDEQWMALLRRVTAQNWSKDIVELKQESVLECFPKEKLVYLTADTTNVCEELDPSKVYVIGCLLDHNSRKGETKNFADQSGIRTERLPIPENIEMEGRHVLTINHVQQILVNKVNGDTWREAMLKTIPKRKMAKAEEE